MKKYIIIKNSEGLLTNSLFY